MADGKRTRSKGSGAIGAARRQSILALMSRGEIIAVNDLAERFQASPETIRRDLRGLEEEGLLKRVHGGVQPARTIDLTARRPIAERLDIDRDAKRAAAQAALPLFSNDMTVYLDGGSTVLFLAEALAESGLVLNVTTHVISVALMLAGSPNCTVNLLGGVLNPRNHALGGPEVIRGIRERLFDLTVMGCSAVQMDYGILGATRTHVELASVLRAQSSRLAFVLHRGKIGKRDANIMLGLDRADVMALDGEPSPDVRGGLAQHGIDILTPPPSAQQLRVG